jgi:hypothetical protein
MSQTLAHQEGPLMLGTVEATAGEPVAQGSATPVQTANVVVGVDAPATELKKFRVPAGSQLLDIKVIVSTAFDSGTTATLKLATAAGDIITAIDLTAAGVFDRTDGTITVSRWLAPAPTDDTTILVQWDETGAAASAGSASLQLHYVQGVGTN